MIFGIPYKLCTNCESLFYMGLNIVTEKVPGTSGINIPNGGGSSYYVDSLDR